MTESSSLTVAASGYFDPLHAGHVEYLVRGKQLAGPSGRLVVIVNSDAQAAVKKGRAYLSQADRLYIVGQLACVDEVVVSVDEGPTVVRTLEKLHPDLFAKGGDRTAQEIPERDTCHRLGIRVVDGLGEKVASSSAITAQMLRDVVARTLPIPAEQRPHILKSWGHEEWIVNLSGLYCGKRLHIRAGAATSWHYHRVKDETLFVTQGQAHVFLSAGDEETHADDHRLFPGHTLRIEPGVRHRIRAEGQDLCLYEFSTFHSDDDVVRLSP